MLNKWHRLVKRKWFGPPNAQCSLKLDLYITLWLCIHQLKVKFIFLLQSNIFYSDSTICYWGINGAFSITWLSSGIHRNDLLQNIESFHYCASSGLYQCFLQNQHCTFRERVSLPARERRRRLLMPYRCCNPKSCTSKNTRRVDIKFHEVLAMCCDW